ncbi:MAG TPA: ABC transporter substrate-binding protein [Burkholderiaceae bacterium]|nr:ABC transporter substrate-binding protein [Burkholderiaceae bacterium]
MTSKHPPSNPRPSGHSRRAALHHLGSLAAAGWAPATVGALWATANAAAAQTPKPPSAAASTLANGVRLITVGGALTETAYALGLERMLVGTDTTSLYPAAAQATPKVGYLRQLSAEGVLSLKPTAVVTTTEAGPPVVMDQLRAAGVRVEQVKTDHTWDEVRRKVEAMGRATAQPEQAGALWQRLDADWLRTQAQVARLVQARQAVGTPLPKVLFLLSHSGSPQASGEGTAADAIVRFLGVRNAMAGAYGFKGYKPITPESMAAAAPDLILTTTQGLEAVGGEDGMWKRPELQLTPAYRHRHAAGGSLIHLDALELLGFGPRMPATIAALAQRVLA